MVAQPKPGDHDTVVEGLLSRINEGDRVATSELFGILYQEIHRSAERLMAGQPADHTLQATALVHEVYLRLLRPRGGRYQDKRHFLATAATAMRCVLVDHARRKRSRPGATGGEPVALDAVVVSYEERALDLLALDEAIREFAEREPKLAQAIDLRFFAGLRMQEVADILEMPLRSLERGWNLTRRWIFSRLQ